MYNKNVSKGLRKVQNGQLDDARRGWFSPFLVESQKECHTMYWKKTRTTKDMLIQQSEVSEHALTMSM